MALNFDLDLLHDRKRERGFDNSLMCQSLSRLGCFIGFFWAPSMLEKDFMCPYTTNIYTVERLAILLTIVINIRATSQRSTCQTVYLTSSCKTIKWLHWLRELIIGEGYRYRKVQFSHMNSISCGSKYYLREKLYLIGAVR